MEATHTPAATESTPVPASAAWISNYLALFGAAQVLWLHWAGAEPRAAAAVMCAAPTLLAALFAWQRAPARLLACGALLPPALLLWLQAQPVALPPVVTALHALLCLACHAAACTAAMERLGLPAFQFSWVTSLVFKYPSKVSLPPSLP